jgi:hypothetical protein
MSYPNEGTPCSWSRQRAAGSAFANHVFCDQLCHKPVGRISESVIRLFCIAAQHAEFIIGRAFARPVGYRAPRSCTSLPYLTRQCIFFETKLPVKMDGCPDHPRSGRGQASGRDECDYLHTDLHFKTASLLADTASRSRRAFRASLAGNFLTLRSEGAGNAGRPMRPPPRVQ